MNPITITRLDGLFRCYVVCPRLIKLMDPILISPHFAFKYQKALASFFTQQPELQAHNKLWSLLHTKYNMSIGKEQAETTSHPEKLELEHGLQLEFEPVPVTNNIIPQAEGSSSSCPVNEDVTSLDEKKVLEGLSVLLVEDQAVLQRIGIRMLKKLGAGVTLVKNGEAAVEAMTLMINAARKNHQIQNLHHGSNLETHNSPHYDLILMDCQVLMSTDIFLSIYAYIQLFFSEFFYLIFTPPFKLGFVGPYSHGIFFSFYIRHISH